MEAMRHSLSRRPFFEVRWNGSQHCSGAATEHGNELLEPTGPLLHFALGKFSHENISYSGGRKIFILLKIRDQSHVFFNNF